MEGSYVGFNQDEDLVKLHFDKQEKELDRISVSSTNQFLDVHCRIIVEVKSGQIELIELNDSVCVELHMKKKLSLSCIVRKEHTEDQKLFLVSLRGGEFRCGVETTIGDPYALPDLNYLYAIPVASDLKSFECIISRGVTMGNGVLSHSFEFPVPEGTPVIAARNGIVTHVIDEQIEHQYNIVLIRHSDGSYGNYKCLKQGTSLVKCGQFVKQGEQIANAGISNTASGSLLFFYVSIGDIRHFSMVSIPILFNNGKGVAFSINKGYRIVVGEKVPQG